jgi:hypothetical protein
MCETRGYVIRYLRYFQISLMAFPDAFDSLSSRSVRGYVLLRPLPLSGSLLIRRSDMGYNDHDTLYELPITVD